VIIVHNDGDKILRGIEVNHNGRVYRIADEIAAGTSVDVEWSDVGEGLEKGDELEIEAHGYLFCRPVTVY